jgi:aminoglycoside phosphotransferase family enzyme/predicted kinase
MSARTTPPDPANVASSASERKACAGHVGQALCRPEAFPAPRPRRVDLVETHLSWVLLTETYAYKVKKPVAFSFVDFRQLESRRLACEAEVALNRRLAGDVYLGTLPVRRAPDGGLTLATEGPGEVVDWAVHMRRLPDASRADNLLARGALDAPMIDGVAARLATFHRDARCDAETAEFGRLAVVAANVEENFRDTRDEIDELLSLDEAHALERGQLSFLRANEGLLERRIQAGRVRDGHGDLRLEHVYMERVGAAGPSHLSIIDCIEFNARFRFADVCADVAFLAMDLVEHGRPDLAERLLSQYARSSDDYDLYGLVDFYEAYRAHVRAKVATFVAHGEGTDDELRAQKTAEARRHFALAIAATRRSPVPPMVIAVGGVIASGKSTVADALSSQMCIPVVDADRTRKHMLGLSETEHVDETPWSGAYSLGFTRQVYDEVLRRAGVVLASGRSVVIDASFRSRALREQARALAHAAAVPFLLVECRADRNTCLGRLAVRARDTAQASDGRAEIWDEFSASFEPVVEFGPEEHLVVDTSHAWSSTIEAIRLRVPMWPAGAIP